MKINLTTQEVIKFAYITKEIIEHSWGAKLTGAQLNCYIECFYTIKDLLEDVDRNYLKKHSKLADYFLKDKRLIGENDRLKWEAVPL